MNLQMVFQMMKRSTASGTGQSYWAVAANCGERRYLSDLHKQIVEDADDNVELKQKGTYFHALMDFWLKGSIPDNLVYEVSQIEDANFAAAARLFKFYSEHFGKDYWGKYIGSEIRLPANDDHRKRVAEYFGHDEITGQLDALYLLDDLDVIRIERDFGLTLRGSGLYAFDWKTAGARASESKASGSYSNSIQAKLYPLLWNLAGGEPCRGMVHVVIVDHKDMRRYDLDKRNLSSVQVFFAPHTELRDREARGAVNFAREQKINRTKNPFACEDYNGRRCPFYGTICQGY